jgi:hypothetical protein
MRMLVLALGLAQAIFAAAPPPSAWVPVRWPWSDVKSLELLAGTPVNCLLLKAPSAEFVAAAHERGLVTLALMSPGEEVSASVDGAVFEGAASGKFPDGFTVIELLPRNKLLLGTKAAVLGTYQGVWPGISADDEGAKKSGPTSGVWIDTNTGFLRALRAWGGASVWIANRPPEKTVISTPRYLQVIADAAISGARWVVAFDDDLVARLGAREEAAMGTWKQMTGMLSYFEAHPEWRAMREGGKLALVQDPEKGGLLSGGILDMIAVKHTPVRPIPRQQLSAEALAGESC